MRLTIRNIEKEVVLKLKQRAAKRGVSMEEELRQILRGSCQPKAKVSKMNFKEYLLTMPYFNDDSLFERKREMPRDIKSQKSTKPKMNFKEFLLTVPDFGENADAHRRGKRQS